MSVINRDQVAAPVLPKETVQVDSLGGEVVVRALLLTERLEIAGRTAGEGVQGAVRSSVSDVLAKCVTGSDGEALWTRDQWEQYGGVQVVDALNLFNVALRLSGMDKGAARGN